MWRPASSNVDICACGPSCLSGLAPLAPSCWHSAIREDKLPSSLTWKTVENRTHVIRNGKQSLVWGQLNIASHGPASVAIVDALDRTSVNIKLVGYNQVVRSVIRPVHLADDIQAVARSVRAHVAGAGRNTIWAWTDLYSSVGHQLAEIVRGSLVVLPPENGDTNIMRNRR
eukprot:CAMPEP_0115719608 /NCGR_PEP_ID=MMETSP0272-20121206/78074_1 /TAXON_ID=71861 /ORGANISM="Scrippsiella trochoidea, Strain CCMP3099" /LENGTH=170 /DNA_ID=CAMNT_0003162253 /DNA_START=394 /DNA_END=907 /DNA_ORIENTATION=+